MRLIGKIKTEKEAYLFYSFLVQKKILCSYETTTDPLTKEEQCLIWVIDEDDLEKANQFFDEFQKDPHAEQFTNLDAEPSPPPPIDPPLSQEKSSWNFKLNIKPKNPNLSFSLTVLLLGICVLLFLWNGYQKGTIENEKGILGRELSLSPLEQLLFFDYSLRMESIDEFVNTSPLKPYDDIKDLPPEELAKLSQAEQIPAWDGAYALLINGKKRTREYWQKIDLFGKIRKGQLWRLVSPVFLHYDFLHILFNMAWLWILGRQIEERLSRTKMFVLLIIIGIVSNVFQYLMSGPYFLGFSGIVVGMAGFIWMRQKVAPWEGYPMHKMTALFILLYVIGILGIQIVSTVLQLTHVISLSPNIANTAHITGGLVGLLLGKFSFFSRKVLG